MRGATRRVAACVAVAATLGACGGGGDEHVPTYTERDGSITVEAGDRFAIRLESNPSTGSSWKISRLPAKLQLVDTRTEEPDQPRPGAGGHQVFELQGLRAGNALLELQYVGPDPASSAFTKPVTFTVKVR